MHNSVVSVSRIAVMIGVTDLTDVLRSMVIVTFMSVLVSSSLLLLRFPVCHVLELPKCITLGFVVGD